MINGADRTTQYAVEVLAGKIAAGKTVKQACERHINDIKRSKDDTDFKYYFDVDEAEDIINFAETLIIAEGEDQQNVVLYPFQCFILGALNGWRKKTADAKTAIHARRFRTSYVQLGRQNGKSFLNGILATYYGNFVRYRHGQIYCTATKKEQADIVFKEVVKFIRSDKELNELFKIHEHNSTIDCLITESKIRALSGDTKSIDGFRPLLGIVDEYHAHRTNQMYKLLEGGIKKMKSALISVITTAGFNLKSPCYKLYETCKKILSGALTNDTQFVFIAEIDEGDDLYKPENWVKANPALEYDPEALENMIPVSITAKEMGGEDLRDFLVKQLNQWVQWASNRYIKDIAVWKALGTDQKLEAFRGKKCYCGIDLSAGGDLTSIALVFPFMADGTKKYYVYSHSFMPSKRVDEHIQYDGVPYDIYIKHGLLTVTETLGGIKTDYKYIISHLAKLIETYDLNIKMICYDPHNASAFVGDLERLGYDCLSITQTPRILNDPTVDFRLEIMAGNVQYDWENELLTLSIENAKTISNSYGEIKIDKDLTEDRIDPVDSVIDAWVMAMKDEFLIDTQEMVNEYLAMLEEYKKPGKGVF